MKTNYDVIIIGNGMTGASLACALAPLNLKIAIVDRHPIKKTMQQPTLLDGRKIALSFASCKILQQIQVWPILESSTTAIRQVHISQKDRLGALRIDTNDIAAEALGYVVAAEAFNQALYTTLANKNNIEWLSPATLTSITLDTQPNITIIQNQQSKKITAKLIVAADGALSHSRQLLNIDVTKKDYQQTALVTSVQLNRPHHHIAYQRFTNNAVIAMLPMQKQAYGVVYTATDDKIKQLSSLNDAALIEQLQQQFGYRLGRLNKLGRRFTYPIKLIIAAEQVKSRFLLLGNAAHNISPIAAQGFNLTLQDIYCLLQLIKQHGLCYDNVLDQYQQQRFQEQQRIIKFTDQLMSYSKKNIILPKTVMLSLIDLIPSLKKKLAYLGMGLTPQIQLLMRNAYAARL